MADSQRLMTEIKISQFGEPNVLVPNRVAIPEPADGELLVRVQAAGVNRPDVFQRLGKYPSPPGVSTTPGLEIAGEVMELGAGVTGFAIGDRVCALTNGGGYAEVCVVPASQTLPWPSGFDAVHAAALPETFFTVWANLFQIGKVKRGDWVLVHGGTSGIGMTAVQLAKPFGYQVIATAGSADKCAALQRQGAVAVNYREQNFVEVVGEITRGRGVDIVLDIIGAAYFEQNLESLAIDGRLLLIGFLGGVNVKNIDLSKIMGRRLIVTGSQMRPRTGQEKATIARELYEQVWPHLQPGQLEPIIHATFPLSEAAAAHRLMESSQHIGKIVLTT